MRESTKLAIVIGGIVLAGGTLLGNLRWGAESVNKEIAYEFNYKGTASRVIKDKRRFSSLDSYFIQVGDDKITSGTLTSDEGKRIRIQREWYEINGVVQK